MAEDRAKYRESDLAAQVDSIRDTIKRSDEATLAAADSISKLANITVPSRYSMADRT